MAMFQPIADQIRCLVCLDIQFKYNFNGEVN